MMKASSGKVGALDGADGDVGETVGNQYDAIYHGLPTHDESINSRNHQAKADMPLAPDGHSRRSFEYL
jgi:hypothetical protein